MFPLRVLTVHPALWVLLLVGGMSPRLDAAPPLIIAHRGASHEAPENTLAAFRLAWDQGADGIEGDFYLSKDNQIVCIHDKTTKRTGNKNLKVADSTFAELRQVDVGSWKDPKYAAERIPTLADVLKTVPKDKLIYVEIKCGPEIVPFLGPVFGESRVPKKQIRIIAFNEEVIAAVKEQLPGIKAYWLTSYKRSRFTGKWSPSLAEVRATLKEVKADGLGTKAEPAVISAGFVRNLRADGHEFHTWTIDDVRMARQFQNLGVDSITTNRPSLLRKQLLQFEKNRQR